LAHTPSNTGYLSDYRWCGLAKPSFLLEDGHEYYVMFVGIPREESINPFMTPVAGEKGSVTIKDPWIKDRYYWGPSFTVQEIDESTGIRNDPIECLVEAIKDRGLEKSSIGLEMRHIPQYYYNKLSERLPQAELKDAEPSLWRLRMVKSKEEIVRMKKAAEKTEKAIEVAFNSVEEGMTELETERIIMKTLIEQGAEWEWNHVAFGPKGAVMVEPTDNKLYKNDIVRLDVGGHYKGYYCDMSRVAVFGKASDKVLKYHKAVLKTNEMLRSNARPGVKCSDLCKLALEAMRKEGFKLLVPQAGHSIGRDVHEPPFLTPDDHTILEPDMIIDLEVAMRVKGIGSINVEDEVLITEEGNETITTLTRELIRI